MAPREVFSSARLIYRFVRRVFPLVEEELDNWRQGAGAAPDPVLSAQAAASIAAKRFHAQGGSIYALYSGLSREQTRRLTVLIVALQTISDYLDNLCDRAGVFDEAGFFLLHRSMLDALEPCSPGSPAAEFRGRPAVSLPAAPACGQAAVRSSRQTRWGRPKRHGLGAVGGDQAAESADTPAAGCSYYAGYPYQDDGGYLESLVRTCRRQVALLPAYGLVSEPARRLVQLYSEMQSLKHLELAVREEKLRSWASALKESYPDLYWWELAAAAGSTLGVFTLLAGAASPALTPATVAALTRAYFPWVAALHILLDYLIDQEEDRREGDLNFVSYYRDREECASRLVWVLERALAEVAALPHPFFHRAVIQGLLALYLSDPKARGRLTAPVTSRLLAAGGLEVRLLERTCRALRRRGLI